MLTERLSRLAEMGYDADVATSLGRHFLRRGDVGGPAIGLAFENFLCWSKDRTLALRFMRALDGADWTRALELARSPDFRDRIATYKWGLTSWELRRLVVHASRVLIELLDTPPAAIAAVEAHLEHARSVTEWPLQLVVDFASALGHACGDGAPAGAPGTWMAVDVQNAQVEWDRNFGDPDWPGIRCWSCDGEELVHETCTQQTLIAASSTTFRLGRRVSSEAPKLLRWESGQPALAPHATVWLKWSRSDDAERVTVEVEGDIELNAEEAVEQCYRLRQADELTHLRLSRILGCGVDEAIRDAVARHNAELAVNRYADAAAHWQEGW